MNAVIEYAAPEDCRAIFSAEQRYIDCPWTMEQIKCEIDNPAALFLVVKAGEEFCGYASCAIAADECEMSNIAVEEAFRRRGVGYALIERLIALSAERGAKRMFLLVRDDNEKARALYEKCGFAVVGRRPNYYKGRDALIMRLLI